MSHHDDTHAHHVTPIPVFLRTFAALIFLTVLTVTSARIDLGAHGFGPYANIFVAMFIATIKAALVATFFMQLKWDETGNKIALTSSVVFVLIFIGITATDVFFRETPHPVIVDEGGSVQGGGKFDQKTMVAGNAELIAQGKKTFETTCWVCHGKEGKGDGPGSKTNPAPRNFTTGEYKFGGTPSQIVKTLALGSPGTAMASYAHLSLEERFALAHYVRTFHAGGPEDTDETVKASGVFTAAKGDVKKTVPVEFAMERMEDRDQVVLPAAAIKDSDSPGAQIYMAQCLNCHGVNGVGAEFMAMGVNPSVAYITKSWVGSNGSWVNSKAEFIDVVSQGLPGLGKPGFSNFSQSQWDQLYNYSRGLTSGAQ